MKGHTLGVLAALLLGNGAASAAAPPSNDLPLAQRLQRAQAVLERLEGLAAETGVDKPSQLSQHWHNHHWNNWHNWHNWGNHHHH